MTDIKQLPKKHRALELYRQFGKNSSRQELITMFEKQLGIPVPSARTYVSQCAKELNPVLGKEYKTRKVNVTNTKKAKAMEIFSANPQLNRKEMINKFETELGMNGNSASTHCSMCVKAYTGKNHTIQMGKRK